ncbi:hypothetical protein BDV36DRAFT_272908, partial [Aspergillus pseudocaelatus]
MCHGLDLSCHEDASADQVRKACSQRLLHAKSCWLLSYFFFFFFFPLLRPEKSRLAVGSVDADKSRRRKLRNIPDRNM